MYMYRLHIGFNNNSRLRGCFYFLYFPELPHFQLLWVILNVDFKYNYGVNTEEIFLSYFPGRVLFI